MSQKTAIPLPILKYNCTGELMATYKRLIDVITDNKIGYYKLEQILISGEIYKGFVYKPSGVLSAELISKSFFRGGKRDISWEPPWTSKQPWEGEDGMFDIKGWSKSIY